MKKATSYNELYHQILIRKVAFFVTFFIIVLVTYAFLVLIDFIPEPIEETVGSDTQLSTTQQDTQGIKGEEKEAKKPLKEVIPIVASPLPKKIIFDTLDKEITVLNPESRAVADLDEALLSGAVRHPDSADFSQKGNVFILAHSSYLPNVFNKNFQAFNGIQNLSWGDTVRLQSEDTEYIYQVEKSYEAIASEVFVPETPGEARLTLATCNSFGTKDDRFIVEARLIGTKKL